MRLSQSKRKEKKPLPPVDVVHFQIRPARSAHTPPPPSPASPSSKPFSSDLPLALGGASVLDSTSPARMLSGDGPEGHLELVVGRKQGQWLQQRQRNRPRGGDYCRGWWRRGLRRQG